MSKTIVVTLLLVVASIGGLLYWSTHRGSDVADAVIEDSSHVPADPARTEREYPREDAMSETAAPPTPSESDGEQAAVSDTASATPAASAADVVRNPVPIIAAVGRLLASEGQLGPGLEIPAMHRQLEREEKDLEWSPQVEYEIRRFMDGRAAAAGFTIDLIECRATLCEIQSTASDASLQGKWGELVGQMRREPWATTIGSAVYSGAEDGMVSTLGIVTIARRRQ